MKFIGTSTAPILAIANLITANPCEFLAITAILSPAEMPRANKCRANWLHAVSNALYVHSVCPQMIAVLSGNASHFFLKYHRYYVVLQTGFHFLDHFARAILSMTVIRQKTQILIKPFESYAWWKLIYIFRLLWCFVDEEKYLVHNGRSTTLWLFGMQWSPFNSNTKYWCFSG